MYTWIESYVYDNKIGEFSDSSILVLELYDDFSSYNCNNCYKNEINEIYNKKCFYCFSRFLENKLKEDNLINNLVIEFDNLEDYKYQSYKYLILGYETKEIIYMADNNYLVIYFKKISESQKNKLVDNIYEKLKIYLSS